MSKEPRRNVYVGHRYVPLVIGEWDKTETYEGLSIVTYQGASYTSKKRVPRGIDILNKEYWALTGNYNAQIEEYRKDVDGVKNDIVQVEKDLQTDLNIFENKINNDFSNFETDMNNKNNQLTNDMNNFKQDISTDMNLKMEQVKNETDQEIKKYHSLRMKPLELIAHRGFADLAPENTMIAFTNAHAKNAHSLECDVQITSDGIPVIIHDSTVNRTTNGSGRVDSFTLSELRSLDAGSKLGGSLFKDTKIPTFEEFLIFAKGRTNKIYPEIKGIRNVSDIGIIINLIKRYNMEEMTCIQSFEFEHLNEVRKHSSIINFGYLTETIPTQSQLNTLEKDGNSSILGKYTLFLNNSDLVETAYAKNIDVGTWTVNDLEIINELLDLGIYKIMSNVSIGGF